MCQRVNFRVSSPIRWVVICLLWLTPPAASQDEPPRHRDDRAANAANQLEDDVAQNPQVLVPRPKESLVQWMIRSCGFFGQIIPSAGFVCVIITLAIVIRGHGPFAAAALLLIVPIPLLLGLFGSIMGLIMSFQVIASSITPPKPSEVADGFAAALFTPLLGLLMMVPGYLVAMFGALYRSLVKPELPPK